MSTYNPKASLRVMKLIFTVIFFSPILFFIVYLLTFDFALSSFEINSIYNLGILAIIAIILPGSIAYSNRILKSIKQQDSLQSRMAKYQTSMIIRLAAWEALGLFSLIAMIDNNNIVVLAFFVISICGLFMNYPSIKSLGGSIQLSPEELKELKS